MPANDGSDLVAAVAAEIAKQLPVKAATEPGALQVGELGSDLMKTLRLALLPIRYLAEQFDRVDRFISANAQKVPLEQRIEPAGQIVGPILEGIRYEPEGSMIDEAFGQLLQRAFDRERAGQAHPAFPSIIRSLADDELKLLMRVRQGELALTIGSDLGGDFTIFDRAVVDKELEGLICPGEAMAYATHLEALGLVHDLVATSPEFTDYAFPGPFPVRWTLSLSPFGRLFTKAVLDPAPTIDANG